MAKGAAARQKQQEEEEDSPAAKKEETAKKEKEEDFVEPAAISGTEVYKHALKSVALILSLHQGGGVSLGTGTLIDQKNRLILTNYHVAATGIQNKVYFAIYRQKDGSLIVEPQKFLQLANKDRQNIGRLVASDRSKDLALVQIDFIPKETLAMAVARGPVAPGQSVYSIGNAGATGGSLWGYFDGKVRQVVQKTFLTGGPGMPPFQVTAQMVEATNPSNPGDSGGPLINEYGELVGVTQGGRQDRQQMNHFIAASEATRFIEEYFQKLGQQWFRATPSLGGTVDVAGLIKRLSSPDTKIRSRAIATLGKIGPPARLAVPALLSTMKDSDDLVRHEAVAALKKIGPPEKSEKVLLERSLQDANPEVRAYAAEAIGKLGQDARQEVGSLAALLKNDKEASVRHSAAAALGMMGAFAKDQVSGILVKALDDPDKEVRLAAGEALSNMEPAASDIPSLVKALKQQDTEVRVFAARALGNLGPQARGIVPDLIEASKNADGQARGAAISALGQVGSEAKNAVPSIIEAMKQKDTRDLAIVALGKIGPDAKAAVPDLAKNLKEKDSLPLVIEALGKIGPDAKAAVPDLADLLKNTEKEMRPAILNTLGRMGPAAKVAVPAIGDCLDSNEKETSIQALQLLAALGPDAKDAVGQIIPLFADDEVDKENRLRTQAAKTLGKIGKPAVSKLQTTLQTNRNRYIIAGVIEGLGEIGPDAKQAVRYIQPKLGDPDPLISVAANRALAKILR
jgi:HEAT repeat protein/S1-C subfamily serine protease